MRPSTTDPTGDKLRKILGTCPFCNEPLNGHRYVEMSCAFREATVAELIAAVKSHRWADVTGVKEWDPLTNAVVVYALECARRGILVVGVRSPFELYEPDALLFTEKINGEEATRLQTAVAGRHWNQL